MSNVIDPQEIARADTIAFHFYTKLFYVINQARATEGPSPAAKSDKWFNLESPDSELLPKEARDAFKSISSLIPSPGIESFEVQVLLSVPELANNQVLVYQPPDSSRVRLEPTPRFILLESWKLDFDPNDYTNSGIAAATTYKHGIVLFRSLFSLLRLLPTWKLYKRLRRKTGGVNRNGNLGIQLRVRSYSAKGDILGFGDAPCPSHVDPLPTSTHSFTAIPHLAGSFSLTTTYLSTPNFQLDELESILSSRFLSLDHQDFVPTLDKNRQRDSITGSSLPTSSGIRSTMPRSPPRPIGRVMSGTDRDSIVDRFILPSKVSHIIAPSLGTSASTGASALIPPPRPIPPHSSSTSPFTPLSQTPPASALSAGRIRKESFNSAVSSSSMSTRDMAPQMSSASSSPATGAVPIVRRPTINTVHPFKSNTLSSHSGSSPSLSIRQGVLGGSPLSTGGLPSSLSGHGHSRQPSLSSASPTATRFSPSPIPGGPSSAKPSPPTTFAPSSLGDRRPGTSGSGGSNERRQSTITFGSGEPEEPFVQMPPRKRYSSSFSHRYVGSLGSAAGGSSASPVDSTSGTDTPASMGGRLSAGLEGRKEHPGANSYMSNTTDDDEISIFVQDIDARKPLSGRTKEREERERESFSLLGPRNETRRPLGQGHDRETTDTTIRARRRDIDPSLSHQRHSSDPPRSSPLGFTRPGIDHTTYDRDRDPSSSTSPPPPSGISAAAAAAAAAASSVSPTRGAMLTSRDEVDERLKMMNEKFMNSLKVLDQAGLGTTRMSRTKNRPAQLMDVQGPNQFQHPITTTSSPTSSSSGAAAHGRRSRLSGGEDASESGSSGEIAMGVPGVVVSPQSGQGQIRTGLGIAMGERGYGRSPYDGTHMGMNMNANPNTNMNMNTNMHMHMGLASRGLGLGRGHLSSSSGLQGSDGDGGSGTHSHQSQGSEEVVGRMDLYHYEERKGRFSEG